MEKNKQFCWVWGMGNHGRLHSVRCDHMALWVTPYSHKQQKAETCTLLNYHFIYIFVRKRIFGSGSLVLKPSSKGIKSFSRPARQHSSHSLGKGSVEICFLFPTDRGGSLWPHIWCILCGTVFLQLHYMNDTSLGEKPFDQGGSWKEGVARALEGPHLRK